MPDADITQDAELAVRVKNHADEIMRLREAAHDHATKLGTHKTLIEVTREQIRDVEGDVQRVEKAVVALDSKVSEENNVLRAEFNTGFRELRTTLWGGVGILLTAISVAAGVIALFLR